MLCILPAVALGGSTTRPDRGQKNKKKVRHPGLESGESAWKAEVLPLHQWRLFSRAQHRWVRSDESWQPLFFPYKYGEPAKTARFFCRGFCLAFTRATKHFRSCITLTSTGTTVSSLRIATYAPVPAAQFQKLKRALAVSAQHATTNNTLRNNRRSARAAAIGAATATTTKRHHTTRAADGLDRGAAPDVLAFGSSRRIWKRTRL